MCSSYVCQPGMSDIAKAKQINRCKRMDYRTKFYTIILWCYHITGWVRQLIICYCPKHCFRLIEGQQSAGVGVKISWVKQQFEILPASGLEPLSSGMGTWNAASTDQLDHYAVLFSELLEVQKCRIQLEKFLRFNLPLEFEIQVEHQLKHCGLL